MKFNPVIVFIPATNGIMIEIHGKFSGRGIMGVVGTYFLLHISRYPTSCQLQVEVLTRAIHKV